MRSVRVPAEIILTFPPQVKVTDEVVEATVFACEQHLNSIGMINYKGPMIQVGTIDFGLRVHITGGPMHELKGEVLERFAAPLNPITTLLGRGTPDAKGVPSTGGVDYPEPNKEK